ncbi:MAG: BCCT family transporter [Nitrococcus sp.]|nr:BCCT family transporter [Nitrococcus sp.]
MRKALRALNSSIDPWVFYVAVALTGLFVLWGTVATKSLAHRTSIALDFTIANFGWAYVLSAFGFVLFMLYLAFSRYGRIRLGEDDDKPEFRTTSWIAMMFSAGMGIGLMFYGVAEPMSHFIHPPFGLAQPRSPQAAQLAMQYTVFHWAMQPWAVYALFGLAVGYFTFRKGQKNLVSESFRPLIGHRVEGPTGRVIEILAILATLFGSATSLGLGALQINSGLAYLWGIPNTIGLAIGVIAAITMLFIISAVSGIHRGIEWLSNTNMILAILLVLFFFIVGPTVYILDSFVSTIGYYFQNYLTMSFRTGAYGGNEWLGSWTIFYWAWWISWAPFVGTFVARISRGRTIREFVIGVLAAPSVICLAWFAVLGGTALHLELSGAAGIADAAQQSHAAVLFATLDALPWSFITSFLAVILIALFFISGADAAAVVMGMLSSHGNLRPNVFVVIIWGMLTGAAAAILLLAGGLSGLQTGAILSAGPFMIVLIGMCFSLRKALHSEPRPMPDLRAGRSSRAIDAVPDPRLGHGQGSAEEASASSRVGAANPGRHRI